MLEITVSHPNGSPTMRVWVVALLSQIAFHCSQTYSNHKLLLRIKIYMYLEIQVTDRDGY